MKKVRMIALGLIPVVLVGIVIFNSPALNVFNTKVNPAAELAGLWKAQRHFGPNVRGPLLIRYRSGSYWLEVAGRSVQSKETGSALKFELPDGEGEFQGKLEADGAKIVGHWIQPATFNNRPYASPVTLTRDGQDIWRGDVSPLEDTTTFFLMVRVREDGSVGGFIRNPERNLGRLINVDHIEREGESVRLVGQSEGTYRNGVLSIYFRRFGGAFDFSRVQPKEASDFYPRGRPSAPYKYAPPPASDDGWPTASLEDVGISREGIQQFIRMIIDTPIDSVSAPDIHGVLIARHGKLVLEEYFHGYQRDKPHDTRSAAKSLTATLLGAAIHAGLPLDASTPVYRVMNGGAFPANLEPRKRALTIEHLLTMSSGFDCDDGNSSNRGSEDAMQQQSYQPDWYRYTLDLPMVRRPGEKAVYCAANSNLVGGVLARVSKESLPVLFQRLLAEPLQIKSYYMNLTPTGDAYMGGGVRFLPRDFMKLGQLHLNGGTWNGRRVLTPEWSRRATSHLVNIGTRKYGYQWWVEDYPYKGRTVRAFFAGGNGGQIVMGIPDLDLLIAFYGGNYNDPALFIPQNVYVPQYILPAVDEHH